MRIELLPAILDVAKLNSISQAARNAYMQQTTLSAAIHTLEKELGYRIFRRRSDGVELTEEGELFMVQAEAMLTIYKEMKAIGNTASFDVKIMVNHHMFDFFSARILPSIVSKFSNLTISIEPISFSGQLQSFDKSPSLKIGIYGLEKNAEEIEFLSNHYHRFLTSAQLKLYVQKTSPIAASFPTSLSELQGMRSIRTPYSSDRFYLRKLNRIVQKSIIVSNPLSVLLMPGNEESFVVALEEKYIAGITEEQKNQLTTLDVFHERMHDFYLVCSKPILKGREKTLVDMIVQEFLALE